MTEELKVFGNGPMAYNGQMDLWQAVVQFLMLKNTVCKHAQIGQNNNQVEAENLIALLWTDQKHGCQITVRRKNPTGAESPPKN